MFRNLRLVYVTTKDREEARKIGAAMVEEKLAACANIIDGMESIYRWEEKVETGKETVLILKTTYNNITKLTRRIKELHSYDVPAIVSINLAEQEGNAEYLNWVVHSVLKPIQSDEDSFI
tara:strand:- start:75167 stop:75526 length:360 start_codon:yes stop_codon:yes gene_type:complete